VTESDGRPSSGERAFHHEETGNEPKRGLAQGLTGGEGAGGLVESGTPMGSSKGFHGVHLSPAMPAPSQPHPTAVTVRSTTCQGQGNMPFRPCC
jgi:hypothetical protein